MHSTIRASSYSGLRDQIMANLTTCYPLSFALFEINTADLNGFKTAWVIERRVIDSSGASTDIAIMKGPPCATHDEALEGLLQVTSVLVGETLQGVFREFEDVPSEMVGDGFVREDAKPFSTMGPPEL